MEKSYRSLDLNIETRRENEEELIIEGYFAVFDDEIEYIKGYFESIDKNAFNNSLSNNRDIRALADHDSSKVLGRTKNGTLKLNTDEKGLYGVIKINKDDTEALNLYKRVKRGDIDQCSFGFYILDQEERWDGDDLHVRITDLELFEVSVVTFPAYSNTSVEARADELGCKRKKKIELWKNKILERIN